MEEVVSLLSCHHCLLLLYSSTTQHLRTIGSRIILLLLSLALLLATLLLLPTACLLHKQRLRRRSPVYCRIHRTQKPSPALHLAGDAVEGRETAGEVDTADTNGTYRSANRATEFTKRRRRSPNICNRTSRYSFKTKIILYYCIYCVHSVLNVTSVLCLRKLRSTARYDLPPSQPNHVVRVIFIQVHSLPDFLSFTSPDDIKRWREERKRYQVPTLYINPPTHILYHTGIILLL